MSTLATAIPDKYVWLYQTSNYVSVRSAITATAKLFDAFSIGKANISLAHACGMLSVSNHAYYFALPNAYSLQCTFVVPIKAIILYRTMQKYKQCRCRLLLLTVKFMLLPYGGAVVFRDKYYYEL